MLLTMERRPAGALWESGSSLALRSCPEAIDVVGCRLEVSPSEQAALESLLGPEERAQARRFLAPQRRRDFIVARGRLRELLGRVLGCHPAAVNLEAGPTGKPALAGPEGARIRFSVAHSAGLVLYAITGDHDVGVDLEQVDDEVDWEAVAVRSFASTEQRAIGALPREARLAAFFDCWTRKEAVVKATGEGLRRPFSSFAVSVEADSAAMLSCDPALGRPERWLLAPVPVPATHRAAVAVREGAAAATLRMWW